MLIDEDADSASYSLAYQIVTNIIEWSIWWADIYSWDLIVDSVTFLKLWSSNTNLQIYKS